MYKRRLDKIRVSLNNSELDGIFLIGDYNRNYLSGFTGNESYSLITNDKAYFITDSRYTEQAKIQTKDYEVIEIKSDIYDTLKELVRDNSIKNIGIEEDIVSLKIFNMLKEKVQANFVPLNGMVEKLRIIKDDYEINSISKAAGIADDAFLHILSFIKPGVSEKDIAIELEFFMKKQGAKELSFPSIVASGIRGSLPHGEPSNKIIDQGDFVTMDFGCVFEEYCSDMTRTVVVGEGKGKLEEIYNIVLKAQVEALNSVCAGKKASQVDAIARDIITKEGYGQYFGHGLGHGVGREIHEAPRLSPKADVTLETGMIITIEPGIYIPGLGGIRIEDLAVVFHDGFKVLSYSTKELIKL